LKPSKYDFDPLYHKAETFRTMNLTRHISGTTGQNFMKLGGVIDI
jgi:hypothetical protein